METGIAKTEQPGQIPDPSDVKIKINTLLFGILPRWMTIAEMEMVASHIFEMVESHWKYGGRRKPDSAPEVPRDSGRFA